MVVRPDGMGDDDDRQRFRRSPVDRAATSRCGEGLAQFSAAVQHAMDRTRRSACATSMRCARSITETELIFTLDDHRPALETVRSRAMPWPSWIPSDMLRDVRRRACERQVAGARKPGDRLAAPAECFGERLHLVHAARDQRRAGVLRKPRARHHSAGDGDDVLDRAADFDANKIIRYVRPEILGPHRKRQPRCRAGSHVEPIRIGERKRDRRRGQMTKRSLGRKGRSGERPDPVTGKHFRRHFAEQVAGARLDPLGTKRDGHAVRQMRTHLRADIAQGP
jgi:hypothetical protein